MTDPGSLLDAFERDGWESNPYERMLELAHADGENAANLLSLAMRRSSTSATFLDAAISFVPEPLLPQLAREAVDALLANRENEVAQDAVAYLSLQHAESLQPYLLQLFFDLRPNADTYYANWAWRSANESAVNELVAYMEVADSAGERVRAFDCITESRLYASISAATGHLEPDDLACSTDDYLMQVGLDPTGRFLYADRVFHVAFSLDYLDQVARPAWSSRSDHPSWALPPREDVHRFGGNSAYACGVCGGSLHNLLSFATVPDGIGVSSREQLALATCLSCLGWSEPVLFFEHDGDGLPRALSASPSEPEFPAQPLAECDAHVATTPRRWQWQDWALSNSRENLHRIGGHPSWVQSAEYPNCSGCADTMRFLLQLDSSLPTAEGEEWLWGSGGVCYVFWCDACAVSASLWQCT